MYIIKIRNFIKHLGYKQVLAILFIAAVLYISATSLPTTLLEIGNFLNTEDADIISVRDNLDTAYQNMLEFNGDYLINKGSYINFNGLMARLLGQRYMNERVKLYNGHLTQLTRRQDATLAATQLIKLCNRQKENGGAFLFVLAPFQAPKYEDVMPAGYVDYSNQNSDDLLKLLMESDVPVLDLREEMKNEGISHSEAFFVTDHHWKPETGFWAYTEIVDRLTHSGLIQPIDRKYTDIGEYDIEIKNNWFLGSSGKRTGIFFAGTDDFSVISPRDPDFGKEVSLYMPSVSATIQGSFSETLYNHSELGIAQDFFSGNPYGGYGHGDKSVKHYQNAAAPTELSILAIGDSFALSTFSYLPLVADSMDYLDMRYYNGNFEEYYSEFAPDVVIILVTAHGAVSENTTYDFFGDLYLS